MITSLAGTLGGTALATGGISPTLLFGIVVVAIVVIAITWVLTQNNQGAD